MGTTDISDLTTVPRGWIPTVDLLAWMKARTDAGICAVISPGQPCMEQAVTGGKYCIAHTR